jgi:hypothetical protein
MPRFGTSHAIPPQLQSVNTFSFHPDRAECLSSENIRTPELAHFTLQFRDPLLILQGSWGDPPGGPVCAWRQLAAAIAGFLLLVLSAAGQELRPAGP